MNGYQDIFTLKLKVLGPVFVGSGRELSKKEYLFLSKSEIGVLDFPKFYNYIYGKGLGPQFETFIIKDGKGELANWLHYNRVQINDIKNCIKYTLPCGETSLSKGTKTQVMEFIKDSYGLPYIPGSSVKGMLRTILMMQRMMDVPGQCKGIKQDISSMLESNIKNGRNILSRENRAINIKAFNKLERDNANLDDARNDEMAGLIIGDSKPLQISDLILVQKIERGTDGSEKSLNLLREAVKPGTAIECSVTIDTKLCSITRRDITDAVKAFSEIYNYCFIRKFKGFNDIKEDIVYLGGGSGFASKTVNYALFDSVEGTRVNKEIFDKTNVPKNHKHETDIIKGVSPHIIKCTRFDGKLFQMGKCRLSID